jgi:hypothetical protein
VYCKLPRLEELNVAAKLVVTARKGGSRIALVGASGKELLASVVFTEPRAKGATLRSLKGMLGEDIVIEDHTLSTPRERAAVSQNGASVKRVAKPAKKTAVPRRAAGAGKAPATKAAKTTKAAKAAKSSAEG